MRRFLQLAGGIAVRRYEREQRLVAGTGLLGRQLTTSLTTMLGQANKSGSNGGKSNNNNNNSGDSPSSPSSGFMNSVFGNRSSSAGKSKGTDNKKKERHEASRRKEHSNMNTRSSSSKGKHRGQSPTSSASGRSGSVEHDRVAQQFILNLGNHQIARIDYKCLGDPKEIEMYHTEVPKELRGRGIGKALAKGAFECASRESMRVKLTCDYLRDYLDRFADPKFKKLVSK